MTEKIIYKMKKIASKILEKFGYKVIRNNPFPPASNNKPPHSSFASVMEDLIARGFKTESVLDIGANNGSWSRMMKAIFPSAHFYLIEPQLEMETSLISFCDAYPGSRYFLNGAGKTSGELTLTIWDDKAGSSFIPSPTEIFDYATEKRIVSMITINDLFKNHSLKIPNLIKLDIQGFEIEALKGATNLFGKTEVFILETAFFCFEGMPLFHEVINFMHENGYVVYDFAGFSRRPLDGALGQCDIVFVQEKGVLRKNQQWA